MADRPPPGPDDPDPDRDPGLDPDLDQGVDQGHDPDPDDADPHDGHVEGHPDDPVPDDDPAGHLHGHLEGDFGADFEGLGGFDLHGEPMPLDDHESALVEQDLVDLDQFEATFRADGYRGVSVFCRDCEIEHYYPWDLLRENLRLLLETGETPVHEPAFDPDPTDYVPWDYARGYADALTDAGVDERRSVEGCPSCGLELPGGWTQANFCPRCATPLLGPRLVASLQQRGLDDDEVAAVLHEMGLPG